VRGRGGVRAAAGARVVVLRELPQRHLVLGRGLRDQVLLARARLPGGAVPDAPKRVPLRPGQPRAVCARSRLALRRLGQSAIVCNRSWKGAGAFLHPVPGKR